jgi:hypothetical protein
MNETAPRLRPCNVNRIADQVCGLVQQQIDAGGLGRRRLERILRATRGH